ncbi:MAG: hypothetical protein M0Q21_11085 [Ignavibacteriaceae bacterium]|nr:hypothetical protein [Ignavibacteriaceae bacterium]
MLKLFFSFLLFVSFLSFAQESNTDKLSFDRSGGYARIQSLGNNPFVVDPENMKTNPAYAAYYQNFLWGDLGSSKVGADNNGVGQFAGFSLKITPSLTVGGLLTRKDFQSNSIGLLDPTGVVSTVNSLLGVTRVVNLDNNLELFGSYLLRNMVFGLGVAYASTTDKYTPATGSGDEGSASQFGLNAGLILEVNKDLDVDVDVSLILPSATYTPGTGSKTAASNTLLMVDARAFYKINPKLTVVPLVNFVTVSGTVDQAGKSSDLPSSTILGLGVGINYRAGDFLFAGGPSLMYSSTTDPSIPNISPETSSSFFTFPAWNIGAEWNLASWFIARFGYVASTTNETWQRVISTTKTDEFTKTTFGANDGATLGIGLRFGQFGLDATVNEEILRQGFNNIGGGKATLAYISASYAF